jgi:hypothetical protein
MPISSRREKKLYQMVQNAYGKEFLMKTTIRALVVVFMIILSAGIMSSAAAQSASMSEFGTMVEPQAESGRDSTVERPSGQSFSYKETVSEKNSEPPEQIMLYTAYSMYGGPFFGTDAGLLFMGVGFRVGALSSDIELVLYPGIKENEVFNPDKSENDTADASYLGVTLAVSFSYASPSRAFIWDTGPAAVLDFGGMEGNRHTYIRPAAQTKIDIRIVGDSEYVAYLRIGYRIDAFYKETAPMFGKFESRTDMFATHCAFAGFAFRMK